MRDLFERRGRASGEAGLGLSSPRVSRRGTRAHQRIQAEMEGEGFAAEVPVEWQLEVEGWTCVLKGRVDGVTDLGEHTLVEELKSTAVPEAGLDALVASLRPRPGEPVERRHPWLLQLGLYVLVIEAAGRPGVRGVLRVVSLVDAGQRSVPVEPEPGLADAVRARLARLVSEREEWLAWQDTRRREPVPFPHPAMREGQAEVLAAVEEVVRDGGQLLLSAPTGFGKTAAVLTGALRGTLPTGRPLFLATARTTQQHMPAETAERIAALGAPLRTVTLRAREKVCREGAGERGGAAGSPCRPDRCPRLEDHESRVHTTGALRALRERARPTGADIDAVAARHGLCPYELALDLARSCDLVIGDYNLYFHPRGRLARLFDERDWVVLVDEAHQLPERVMDARSPAVDTARCDAAREWAEAVGAGPLSSWVEAVREEIADSRLRWVSAVHVGGALGPRGPRGAEGPAEGVDEELGAAEEAAPAAARPDVYVVEPNPRRWRDLAERAEELLFDPGLHTLLASASVWGPGSLAPPGDPDPAGSGSAVRAWPPGPARPSSASEAPDADGTASTPATLAEPTAPSPDPAMERAALRVLELLRAVVDFADNLEGAGEELVVFWEGVEGARGDVAARLRLYCRDPSPHLGPLFHGSAAAVLMTATPRPAWFLRDRCGLDPGRFVEHEAPDPFPPDHRKVLVVTGVSTAWRDRERHRARIREQLAAVVAAVPGKLAIFFSSYQQLEDLLPLDALSDHLLLRQEREADDDTRAELLRRLRHTPDRAVLAAVLGGSFAEGVDLPGGVLSAVVVVGPALPPPSPERRLLSEWYEQHYDAGHDLAYIQPGMTRVVQAAGRAVRRPEDRAVIVLLCQRFARNEFRAYLPASWDVERSSRPERAIERFFRSASTADVLSPLRP